MKAKTFFGALLDGVSGDLQNSSIEAKILGDHLLYGRFREARLVEEVGVSVGRSGAPTYAPSIVVAADYDDISIVPTPSPTERPEVLEESSPLEGPTIANELQFSDQRSSNESDNNVEEAIPGTVALGITFGGSDVL